MTKDELLKKIIEDRPDYKIVRIVNFKELSTDNFEVVVDTGLMYYETIWQKYRH